MNFIKKNYKIICVIIVILGIVYLFPKIKEGFSDNKPKIYGRDTCPWTVKQKKYFDNKGIDYDYVDCEVNPKECPENIVSYPTTKVNSNTYEGYKEIDIKD